MVFVAEKVCRLDVEGNAHGIDVGTVCCHIDDITDVVCPAVPIGATIWIGGELNVGLENWNAVDGAVWAIKAGLLNSKVGAVEMGEIGYGYKLGEPLLYPDIVTVDPIWLEPVACE